ncbi:MAG: hypothetical protein ACREXX_13245 [Gammaproteobacteria bacterium]
MNACTLQQARAAKHKAVEMFRGTASVAGIGITRIDDGYGLNVNLERLPESPLPTDVDGVPLCVEIVAQSASARESRVGRYPSDLETGRNRAVRAALVGEAPRSALHAARCRR